MAYARRTDGTHKAVVDAFRRMGWTVLQTFRLGQNAPDLIVASGGRTLAVEVKAAKGKVKPGQSAWLASWPSETAIVRGVEDVVWLVNTLPQSDTHDRLCQSASLR